MTVSSEHWVVVGGGLVGMSVARAVLRDRPADTVTVFDKSESLAAHQSGRNSGVLHSTINYPPGSLKAQLVVRGRQLMQEFCESEGIEIVAGGKWISAVDESQRAALDGLLARGFENGENGLRIVESDEMRELEPHLRSSGALWVPSTSVLDYPLVLSKLAQDVTRRGGTVRLGSEVDRVSVDGVGRPQVQVGDEVLRADRVVICAGLQTDRLCAGAEIDAPARIVPFAGRYLRMTGTAATLLNHTVYPVPDPRLPFLGVHFTKGHDDVWTAGPTALLSLRREPYVGLAGALRDPLSTFVYGGSWRLFSRYWRDGMAELDRRFRRSSHVRLMREMLPELDQRDLVAEPDRLGVRAQAVDRAGNLVTDFLFARSGRVLAVINAPSPAATASLAIGEQIVSRAVSDH